MKTGAVVVSFQAYGQYLFYQQSKPRFGVCGTTKQRGSIFISVLRKKCPPQRRPVGRCNPNGNGFVVHCLCASLWRMNSKKVKILSCALFHRLWCQEKRRHSRPRYCSLAFAACGSCPLARSTLGSVQNMSGPASGYERGRRISKSADATLKPGPRSKFRNMRFTNDESS